MPPISYVAAVGLGSSNTIFFFPPTHLLETLLEGLDLLLLTLLEGLVLLAGGEASVGGDVTGESLLGGNHGGSDRDGGGGSDGGDLGGGVLERAGGHGLGGLK